VGQMCEEGRRNKLHVWEKKYSRMCEGDLQLTRVNIIVRTFRTQVHACEQTSAGPHVWKGTTSLQI
jgi:hypothetical protein